MKVLMLSSILLIVAVGYIYAQSPFFLCPPAEKVKPCECNKGCEQCLAIFECKNLTMQDQLTEVLDRSGDFPFRVAKFYGSVLQYIPDKIFEAKKFNHLVIKDSHLSTLIEGEPKGESTLNELWMGNVRIMRGLKFQSFSSFKILRDLYIEGVEIKRIPNNVTTYLSPKMVYLQFVNTKTSKLGSTTFASFPELDLLVIKQGLITTIAGSMFPKSLTQLVLSQNRIKTLPDGFADELTNLESLFLDGNQLQYLDGKVYNTIKKLSYLNLEDNPIICDCKMRWKLTKPELEIEGTCTDPKDKPIRDITGKDLEYC